MNYDLKHVSDALHTAYTLGVEDERRRAKIAADSEAFYGFPHGSVSSSNAGGKCVTDGETSPTHTLNSTKTVAVATDVYWMPIDKDTPRSAKLQLLSIGGVAQYGTLSGDVSFYTHWCPLPKKRPEPNDPWR